MSKAIYECHVTCDVAYAEICTQVANEFHWKTSQIARDPVLGQATYFYLTTHSDDFETMWDRMCEVVLNLQLRNAPVLREKIELVIHDVRKVVQQLDDDELPSSSNVVSLPGNLGAF